MYELLLPSLFDAWLFWTFHDKSHNMKALVILNHSCWPFLPLTCLHEKNQHLRFSVLPYGLYSWKCWHLWTATWWNGVIYKSLQCITPLLCPPNWPQISHLCCITNPPSGQIIHQHSTTSLQSGSVIRDKIGGNCWFWIVIPIIIEQKFKWTFWRIVSLVICQHFHE